MDPDMEGKTAMDIKAQDTALDDDLYDEIGQEDVKKSQHDESATADDDEYARAFDSPPAEAEETVDSDKMKHVSQASESTAIAVPPDTSIHGSVALSSSSIPLIETQPDGVMPKTDSEAPDIQPIPPKPGNSGAQIKPASLTNDENPNISEILAALSRQTPAGQAGQASDVGADGAPTSGTPNAQAQSRMLAHPPVSTDLPSKPPVQPPYLGASSYTLETAPNVAQPAMTSPPISASSSFFLSAHAAAPGTDSVAGQTLSVPPPLPQMPPEPSDGFHPHDGYTGYVGRADGSANGNYQSQWDTFLADEKRYSSEQNWERFPEGSRIFIGSHAPGYENKNRQVAGRGSGSGGVDEQSAHIFDPGNLSSDKVSKRDVFNVFHRYGRLAQISLKSAFGFVQYHTVEEARAAIDNLQDHEIKGRKIHLEVSRSKNQNRDGSDRGGRGRGGKYDGGQHNRRGRDGQHGRGGGGGGGDYRGHGRDDSYGRDKSFHESNRPRDRSMSPRAKARGRHGSDQYRRRSPSPYGRPETTDGSRYGSRSTTEVLLLILDNIDPQFVSWVREAFDRLGLATGVENFRFDEDKKKFMARKAGSEGIKAVIDLDRRAHADRTVVSYVFDFSRPHDIRYDEFPALPPETAGQVVLKQLQERGYRPAQPSYAPYGGGYPAPQYSPAYHGQGQGSPQAPVFPPPPSAYPPPGAGQGYGPSTAGQPHNVQDILSRLQHSAPPAAAANPPPMLMQRHVPPPAHSHSHSHSHSPPGYGMPHPHFLPQGTPQLHQMPGVPTPPPQGYGAAAPPNVDPQTKQSVDSIMAHLARLRGP